MFKSFQLPQINFDSHDSANGDYGDLPNWDLKDIYLGMMQFMVIQLLGLILILIFPQIVLWLPNQVFGG